MRKNAAMRRGAESERTSAAALIPVAFVALAVLLLALVVKGNQTGTIVVEHTILTSTTIQNGAQPVHTAPFSMVSITQTSADGSEQRAFTSNSLARPGFQFVTAGQQIELYDPLDHTVYETTLAGEQRVIHQEVLRSEPKGSYATVQAVRVGSPIPAVPGSRSIYEQRLMAGDYRIAGRATVDGRPALKLVQTHGNALNPAPQLQDEESVGTVYVSPRTYDPIEEVITTSFSGVKSTLVRRWQTYLTVPSNRRTQRLLSLTSLHPGARVIHNALAFYRAAQSQALPTRTVVTQSSTNSSQAHG